MVFNATFNNISVTSRMRKLEYPKKAKLSGIGTHNFNSDRPGCKSNYHNSTIMTTYMLKINSICSEINKIKILSCLFERNIVCQPVYLCNAEKA